MSREVRIGDRIVGDQRHTDRRGRSRVDSPGDPGRVGRQPPQHKGLVEGVRLRAEGLHRRGGGRTRGERLES